MCNAAVHTINKLLASKQPQKYILSFYWSMQQNRYLYKTFTLILEFINFVTILCSLSLRCGLQLTKTISSINVIITGLQYQHQYSSKLQNFAVIFFKLQRAKFMRILKIGQTL